MTANTPAHLALVALLALGSSGCGVLARVDVALASTGAFDLPVDVDDSCAVTVTADYSRGRGLVVGPRTVLTVAHVVGAADSIEVTVSTFEVARARIVARIPADPEDVLVLELDGFDGFPAERVRAAGAGAPAWILGQHGPRAIRSPLAHGDSGSPIVDAQGLAVGLVVGRSAVGEPVFAPLDGGRASGGLLATALSDVR